jgi:ferritin
VLKLKQTTIDSLKQLYEKLEVITRELYDLADIELELEDFDDASLLQTRANILYEQMENLDVVISELEG